MSINFNRWIKIDILNTPRNYILVKISVRIMSFYSEFEKDVFTFRKAIYLKIIEIIGAASVKEPQPNIVNPPKTLMKKELDFMDCLKPMNYFLRTLGLMPFSIYRVPNGNILKSKVRKWDVMWSLFTLCIYSSCVFISLEYGNLQQESHAHNKSFIHIYRGVIAHNLHTTLGVIFCILFVTMDMCNRNEIVDLFNKFVIFDKEVTNFTNVAQSFLLPYKIRWFIIEFQISSHRIKFNSEEQHRLAWISCKITVALMSFKLTITAYVNLYELPGDSFYYFFPTKFQWTLTTAQTLFFLFLVDNLRKRYAALNTFLRYYIWTILNFAEKCAITWF